MKKFILGTFLFFLPLICLLLPACYWLFSSKENFYNVEKAIGNFDNQKYLIGFLYNESNYRYLKYKSLSKKKATVIALGSSRVLPFRKEMFESEFYNAGFVVDDIQDFSAFLSCLPEKNLPDYLIVGLDQWMFNDAWNDLTAAPAKSHWTKNTSFDVGRGIKKVKDFYPDLVRGRLRSTNKDIVKSSDIELVGLNAHLHATGFRNDGSTYYGELIQKLIQRDTTIQDFNYKDSFKRISNGNGRMEYGSEVSEKALVILNELLIFCKSKKIHVVGFLPPFADAVYTKMKKSGHYGYVEKLYPSVKLVFDKHEFEFYGYNNVSACGSNDSETIDGLHGGEKTYLRILIDMLKNKSLLNGVSSLEKLERQTNASVNNYTVYSY